MEEKKEEKTYPKEWYNNCLDALQEIKDIELKGNEFAPRQKALKDIFKDGRKPKDVIATMKYLEEEKSYDWTLMKTVKMKIPEGVKWSKDKEEKKKISFENTVSVEEVEDFLESFKNWKEESAHGDSPWAFEFYLNDAGVASFRVEESGWKNEVVHDIKRYQKAWKLYEEAKKYEDEQIESEEIEREMDELFDKYEVGKDMPD